MNKILLMSLLALACVLSLSNAALADSISNIRFSHSSPTYLAFDQRVNLTFDYNTTEAGGVRLFVLPFTNGSATPGFGVSGSPLYPVGSGSGSGFLTILSGSVEVDQVRFTMTNADQSVTLLEFFIDVDYFFSEHAINNIVLTPPPFASLALNERVNLTFDYNTTEAGGVRLFVLPFTNGSATPGFGVSGSPLYPVGSGSGSGFLTILSGSVEVDQVRFTMTNADQSVTLLEFFIDVDYFFSEHAINNIVLTPPPFASLALNERVNLTFDYNTTEAGGVRLFVLPFTNGSATPGFGVSGSPLYPVGSGSGSGFLTILSGSVEVDQVRFTMTNADQSVTLLEFFIPVRYFFSEHQITNIDFATRSTAYLTFDERVDLNFDYGTTEAGGVRLFVLPFTDGGWTPNLAVSGSPLYPVGSGSGTGFFTVSSGDVEVDQVQLKMTNADQSVTLLEFFEEVSYHFISRPGGVASEAEPAAPITYTLLQNYPNPFNPSTTIPFTVPNHGYVRLTVHDVLGRQLATLVEEIHPPGRYEVLFDASSLPSGMYVARLETEGGVFARRMVLVK